MLYLQDNYIRAGQMDDGSFRGSKPSRELDDTWILHNRPGACFYSSTASGKWCVVRDPLAIDEAWQTICRLLGEGKLLAAKVSTKLARKITGHDSHVICVYTTDWADEADVYRVRDVLRDAGFIEPLRYKRDLDTMRPELNPDREFYYED